MEFVGTVVRLQVQRASLKGGEQPRRWYDPAPIVSVPTLTLDADGVTGWADDGAAVADIHNAAHPQTKHRGENPISLGFTSHYVRMRARFGDHLTDGIAGENILVETARVLREADFARGVRLAGVDGAGVDLREIIDAEPCAEFSRFALRYDRDTPSDRAVADALNFLRLGTRGFYAIVQGDGGRIHVGDSLFLR